jgi:hypothetical protein
MKHIRARTFILAIFSLVIMGASSGVAAAEWTVSRVTGSVWISSERPQRIALSSGEILDVGSQVRVGPNSRVMLTNGDDVLVAGPGSEIEIPADAEAGVSGIIQRVGEVFYSIDKNKYRQFSVRTHTLATIVKGTQFTVLADTPVSRVSVREGRVLVHNYATGESFDLTAGQTIGWEDGEDPKIESFVPVGTVQELGATGGQSAGLDDGTSELPGSLTGAVGDTVNATLNSVGGTTGAALNSVGNTVDSTLEATGGLVNGVVSRSLGGRLLGGGSGGSSGGSSSGASGGGSASGGSSGGGGSSSESSASSSGSSIGGTVKKATKSLKRSVGGLL